MPGGDRTGPMGMGPMTGRGAGYCAGFTAPGFANLRGRGAGLGRGRGFWCRGGGFGLRNRFYASGQPGWMRYEAANAPLQQPEPELEKQALKNQADALQAELAAIQQRLANLEQKPE